LILGIEFSTIPNKLIIGYRIQWRKPSLTGESGHRMEKRDMESAIFNFLLTIFCFFHIASEICGSISLWLLCLFVAI
jgi:hypothetical protein